MVGVPPFGPGRLSDLPDHRDFTPDMPEVRELFAKLRRRRSSRAAPPASVDLREFCSSPSDQGAWRSTSAHAVLGLVAYFERRAAARSLDASASFLYYTARRLDGITGDNGVGLRTTLKALVRFGSPPERFWPADEAKPNVEPDPFAYGFARDFASLRYLRLDADGDVLRRVKAFAAAGFASVCGAVVPPEVDDAGNLAFPTKYDAPGASAAFTVVGYDDSRRIRSTKGALIVRATRGPKFGDGGYAYLPYRFVDERMARDFWTVWKPEWAASGEFEQVGS